MMKNIFIAFLLISATEVLAQTEMPYHPEADASADIKAAIRQAKKENKHILIQAGGNWCKWCLEFARFAKADKQIDSIIKSSFVWYHLNYSKEQKNEKIFSRYGYPQRFGFPVFIILNKRGERLHTQNSEYLEDGGKSYDSKKVLAFLNNWSPKALDPEQYSSKQ
jgi:thioredoxin-related protein